MQNKLHRKLGRLRGKVKTIQAVTGAGKLVLAIVGLVAFTYVADRLLRLPLLVRSVLLISALGAIALLVNRWLVRPVRRRYSDADLAGGVESLRPELRDRLRSTLDFEKQLRESDFPESRALAERVVSETLDQIEPVSFRGVARFQRAVPWVLGGVIATVGLTAWANRDASHFPIWVKRCLLLDGTTTWPRSTVLRVLMPPAGGAVYVTRELPSADESAPPSERDVDLTADATEAGTVNQDGIVFNLPRGLDFTVNVVADRGDPSEVQLHFVDEETQRESTRLVPRVQPGRYTTTFERLTRSFTFSVSGGDDDDRMPVYAVRVHNAPAVQDLTVEATFPPHARRDPRQFEGGDVEVPVDTLLTFRMTPTMNVRSARLVVTKAEGESETVALARDASGAFVATRRAAADFEYGFALVGENRIENHERLSFRVLTLPDRAPTVKTLRPRSEMVDVTPEGIIPLLALVKDDYGVTATRLLVSRGRAEQRTDLGDAARITMPDDDDPVGDRAFFVFSPLEIASLQTGRKDERPPTPGDVIRLKLDVEDNHTVFADPPADAGAEAQGTFKAQAKAGQSREIKIEVLRKSDLERRINDRQLKVKDEARKALAYLDRVMADTLDLTSQLADAMHTENPKEGKQLEPAEMAEQILSVERRQNRLSSDLLIVLTELQTNLDAYVYNRLEDSPVNQRMLDLFARETRAKPGDDDHRFRVLIDEHRAGRLGQSDVVGKLVAMTDHAMVVGTEASPAAGRSMGRARASGQFPRMAEELKATISHQKRARGALAALVDALSEWEDYQEVIQISKQLIELQSDIEKRTINLIKKNYPGAKTSR